MNRRLISIFTLFMLQASFVSAEQSIEIPKAVSDSQKSICVTVKIISPPKFRGRVNDDAHVLRQGAELRLSRRLAAWEKTGGPQGVVVTIPSLRGIDINNYACTLGDDWGIGNKARNDGIMFLYAIKERKVRIAVGFGLENRLSNTFLQEVIDQNILPELRQARFENATNAALDRIIEKLAEAPTTPPDS
jgi:uncharacterized protein